jgi:hypothetical protein
MNGFVYATVLSLALTGSIPDAQVTETSPLLAQGRSGSPVLATPPSPTQASLKKARTPAPVDRKASCYQYPIYTGVNPGISSAAANGHRGPIVPPGCQLRRGDLSD